MNHEDLCRSAPATPGLINIRNTEIFILSSKIRILDHSLFDQKSLFHSNCELKGGGGGTMHTHTHRRTLYIYVYVFGLSIYILKNNFLVAFSFCSGCPFIKFTVFVPLNSCGFVYNCNILPGNTP